MDRGNARTSHPQHCAKSTAALGRQTRQSVEPRSSHEGWENRALKIVDVASRPYHIPPTVSWEDATHRAANLEFIITRVTTDAGIVGEGFAYTTGIGGSAFLALIDDYCRMMLLGQDPRQIERLWSFLYGQLHRSGTGGINTLALGAIDVALWDIAAKCYEVPLFRLLGRGVTVSPPMAVASTSSSTVTLYSTRSKDSWRRATRR
ncbi:MAG: hypothetical protein EOR75_32915 [Mesorhizobium sp.]|nr:MAG: hypothetical protein EOR75_32915 [Mesorhizobium sp.]